MYQHLIEIQPNRDPFLFIDTIIECNEEKNAITKNSLIMMNGFSNVIGKMILICRQCFNWKL